MYCYEPITGHYTHEDVLPVPILIYKLIKEAINYTPNYFLKNKNKILLLDISKCEM